MKSVTVIKRGDLLNSDAHALVNAVNAEHDRPPIARPRTQASSKRWRS